jgi:galactokinase
MSELSARHKEAPFERALAALRGLGRDTSGPVPSWFVPGRVEVLGKHTDYAGGRSLLAAVERGVCVVALPRSDRTIRVVDVAEGVDTTFALEPGLRPALGHWSNYPMTVARRLSRNFPTANRGADIVIASDLPHASGMSSSSALVVAVALALIAVNELESTNLYRAHLGTAEDLAGYLGCVENGQSFGPLTGDQGVGTFGGSEDHTAILACRPGLLSQYSFCPVRAERVVPFPDDHVLVMAVSGVVAEKTGAALAAYNGASLATRAILALWREHTGQDAESLVAAAASSPDAPDLLRSLVAGDRTLAARLDQLLDESERIIPAAGLALERGDLAALGPLVDASQRCAEQGLANQVPETIWLARSARELGAVAASAFGAGFGGSVWAMAPADDAARFRAAWLDRYRERFPARAAAASAFTTRPGPGATRLDLLA